MLGEKDVSILGRLRDRIGDNFIDFKNYMSEKLEYIRPKLNKRDSLNKNNNDNFINK